LHDNKTISLTQGQGWTSAAAQAWSASIVSSENYQGRTIRETSGWTR
jgi:hypothetical protein